MWFLGIPFLAAVGLFAVGCVIAARALYANRAGLTARQRRRFVVVFLAMAVFLAGFANGVIFFMISAAIGGDAVAGKVEGDRYYVSSKGRLTEVSGAVWEFSHAHAHFTWAASLVAASAFAVAILSGLFSQARRPVPLTITVRGDGAVLVDGQSVTAAEAVARAEEARAQRQEVYVHRAYADAVPDAAVSLCEELVHRGILFQAIDVAAERA